MKRLFWIFNNNGETFDRYTIVLYDGTILGSSNMPFSPLGFGQHCGETKDVKQYLKDARKEKHLGIEVKSFENIPEDVIKFISQYLPDKKKTRKAGIKISYADSICIKEVLKLFPGVNLLYASIVYNKFKNIPNESISDSDFSNYEAAILGIDQIFHNGTLIEYDKYGYHCLSEFGKDFIRLVKARKQTRYLLKKGCDLFPEQVLNANFIQL